MRKKLDGVLIPSARPTVINPASTTRPVALVTPAIVASASPALTIIPAWKKGLRTKRSATLALAPGRPAA